jgi:hypothetical protein
LFVYSIFLNLFAPSRTSGSAGEGTEDEIKIYPNPTEGIFNIDIPATHKEAQITITDLTGKILETRAISDNTGQPVQFSLSNVARGVYLVKVVAGEDSYVEKVIAR